MGISYGVPIVHIRSGVVVGEPLDSGAGASGVGAIITLAGHACVGEDGAESAGWVTKAEVGIGAGACIFCAPVMVASLQKRRIIKGKPQ